jgi:hypothetical protein
MGAVEIDPLNSQMYWVQGSTIFRSDLDGNGAVSLGLSGVRGNGGLGDTLELDAINGKMYWAGFDGIHSSGLDGSNDQLIHASTSITAIELGPTPEPEPDPDPGVIPEPSSLIVWSLLSCIGLSVGRQRRPTAS